MVWLVEPPVAIRPTMALTIDFSLTISPTGKMVLCLTAVAMWAAAARVSASRMGVLGLTKAVLGMCKPIISIIIWLELAVP